MLVGNGSGGCCDCGDPEAFHTGAPRCGIHVVSAPDREARPPADDLRHSIRETMETAIDFAIDVFSTSPLVKEEITEEKCRENAEWSQLLYGGISTDYEEDYGDWVLTLYNDENHSYPDVMSQLKRIDPGRYEGRGAMEAAKSIDHIGREPIMKRPDLKSVITAGQSIMTIGLFCSVRTERDYLRECVGGYILEWLMDCISIGVSVGGDEMILREIMCQALAGPWRMGISHPDPRVELEPRKPKEYFPSETSIYLSDWSTFNPLSFKIEERWIENEYIRLDWVLFFDARLWKSMRKCVKSIILGCLLGGKAEIAGSAIDQWGPRNWKRITGIYVPCLFMIGIRFARDFAQLCRLWLKYDREGHLSVTKLGVQIFTTPSISLELIDKYEFLTHLLAIEYTYFTAEGQIGRPSDVDSSLSFDGVRDQDDGDSWKPDGRIIDIQEDVHHLLGNEAVRKMIPKRRKWLMQILDFFQLFQGMHTQKRETNQHREYESNVWEVARNITLSLTRLLGHLAGGYKYATREELQWAFAFTLAVTYSRCCGSQIEKYPHSDPVRPLLWHKRGDQNVVEFEVASEPVSLHFPLNWMVSLLLSKIVDHDRDTPTDWNWWIPDVSEEKRNLTILACVDYPLRACVFSSQIRAKLWARNGLVMIQQYYAFNMTYAHPRLCSDFIFLQWAFAALPAETMLIAMIDRFDLAHQFMGPGSTARHPVYGDDSLKVMIEEFFQLFLNLMNERNTVLGESPENIVRREIAHRLIFKRLGYSEILRQVKYYTDVEIDDYFDKNLKEMAHFHPPTESQSGAYELKVKYHSLVDPRHRSYTRNQAVECERVLIKLMTDQGILESNRVVEPQERVLRPIQGPFAGLTRVLSTPLFAGVVYCGLNYAIANFSETIMDQVLYLCLIAVMDCTTKHAFVSNAKSPVTLDDRPSVVHMLLSIFSHSRFTPLYPKVKRLLSRMRDIDPCWFESVAHTDLAFTQEGSARAGEAAVQKKMLAKKRQMEALNRMKMAQSKFQEKHKALLDDDSDIDDFEKIDKMEVEDFGIDDSVKTFDFPRGTCILCQGEVGSHEEEAFGVPAMIHQTPIFRTTPLDDHYFVQEVAMTPTSLDNFIQRPFGQANWHGTRDVVDCRNNRKVVTEKILGKGFPRQSRDGVTVTTCCHLLHYRCFQSYFKSIQTRVFHVPRNPPENVDAGEFLCPLCKALSNIIIPINWEKGLTRRISGPEWSEQSISGCSSWLEPIKEIPDLSSTFGTIRFYQIDHVMDPDQGFVNELRRQEVRRKSQRNSRQIYEDIIGRLKDIASRSRMQIRGECDTFSILLAGTVTAMEIAYRGTADASNVDVYPPVIGSLSPSDLMLLRILAQTAKDMSQFQGNPFKMWRDFNIPDKPVSIWMSGSASSQSSQQSGEYGSCLLSVDVFERFVLDCSSHFDNNEYTLIIHYAAEITKIVLAILGSTTALSFILGVSKWECANEVVPKGSRSLLKYFIGTARIDSSDKLLDGIYRLAQRFILPFLRKMLIFIHVSEGFVFCRPENTDEPESNRLCRLLGLPSLADMLDMPVSPHNHLFQLIDDWMTWWKANTISRTLDVHHPAVFQVIGLPERLDILLELASKLRCPVCRQVPDDPAMCLLCGDVVCAQSACCDREGVGEMNLHREEYEPIFRAFD